MELSISLDTTTGPLFAGSADHAGAGGESNDDGKMNTRDFDSHKDEAGEWLHKEVRIIKLKASILH